MTAYRLKPFMAAFVVFISASAIAEPTSFHHRQFVPGLATPVISAPATPAAPVALPPSPTGDGTSKAGACALGAASGCATFSGGLLTPANTGGSFVNALASKRISAGKWYWEMKLNTAVSGGVTEVGLVSQAVASNNIIGNVGNSLVYLGTTSPQIHKNGSTTGMPTVSGIKQNDFVSIAYDADSHTATFYVNCVVLATIGGLYTGAMYPAFADYSTKFPTVTFNFGASAFNCVVPSGYNAGVW